MRTRVYPDGHLPRIKNKYHLVRYSELLSLLKNCTPHQTVENAAGWVFPMAGSTFKFTKNALKRAPSACPRVSVSESLSPSLRGTASRKSSSIATVSACTPNTFAISIMLSDCLYAIEVQDNPQTEGNGMSNNSPGRVYMSSTKYTD